MVTLLARAGDAGPLPDARAKQTHRRRLAEIEEDMEEARADHDITGQEQNGPDSNVVRPSVTTSTRLLLQRRGGAAPGPGSCAGQAPVSRF